MKAEDGFKKLFEGSEKYEHVPLPKSVTAILKRKYKGYTLHAYIYHDREHYRDGKDHRSMLLGFDKIEGQHIIPGPGVSCSTEPCVHDWATLAEDLALSYPDYAIDKED